MMRSILFLATLGNYLLSVFLISLFHPALAQVQDFENSFAIVNHPEEFLPSWSANEVRNNAARVFQANTEGRFGTRALGVQPISSFNGEIYFKTSTLDFLNPKLAFFAKSKINGSGNRPAMLFVSFSEDGLSFDSEIPVGDENTFPNLNKTYSLFEITIPEDLHRKNELWIKFHVKYGPGTGSAARFFMDDVGLFEFEEAVDPIIVKNTSVLNPYTLQLDFNKKINTPAIHQVQISNNRILELLHPSDTTLIIYTNSELIHEGKVDLVDISEKESSKKESVSTVIENEFITLGNLNIQGPKNILLGFSQPFQANSVSQTSHFSINETPPQDISLLENGYDVILHLASNLQLGQEVQVLASSLVNKLSIPNPNNSSVFILYEDYVEDLFVKDAQTLILKSKIDLNKENTESLNFEIEERTDIKLSPILTGDQEVTLKSNTAFEEGVAYSLILPSRESKRGMYIPGSIHNFIFDTLPPSLIEIKAIAQSRLMLVFSEEIDPIFASILNNFEILGQNPIRVSPQKNHVILDWDLIFEKDETYTLQIETVSDLQGNSISNISKKFTFEEEQKLGFKDLVLNEIMPAPRATNPLPNVEFVELYNPTEKPLYLGGMQLANSRRESILPSAVIEPKAYLILCPRNQASQFEKYGDVLGLSNWPTLLNTADQVKLLSAENEILDSLNYDRDTFGGTAIANGGYSLEIANPYLNCYLPSNIKVSQAENRGTPGSKNSVYTDTPDFSEPVFEKSLVIDPHKVLLEFSKILQQDLRSLLIETTPSLKLKNVEIGETQNSLILTFAEPIKVDIKYKLKILNLRDCVGNAFNKTSEVYFVMPSDANEGDIIINEVLFNPRTGAPKFVEIYNSSAKFLNLKDWKLANLNSDEEVANRRVLFPQDFILEPHSFLIFTTDSEKLKQEYPKGKEKNFIELNTLPSYPISAGNVILLNPDESLIEIFSYSDKMHHPLLKETKGVSLERLSPTSPVNDLNNWHSASSTEGYASPGYRNSQNFEGNHGMGIEIQPRVFVPEAAGEQPFTTISYRMPQSGNIATLRIYSATGALVRELCQNAIWGENGFYLWDGTDSNSRKVRPGYYVVWLEIFDLQGKVSQIRKTVIVGTKF
jgi:hypothetical protein